MNTTEHYEVWVCPDCICYFANGDTPINLNEEETDEWLANVASHVEGFYVACGGSHDIDCENMPFVCRKCPTTDYPYLDGHPTECVWHGSLDRMWSGHTDCYCETEEFSWSPCSTCASYFGGSRHLVTLLRH